MAKGLLKNFSKNAKVMVIKHLDIHVPFLLLSMMLMMIMMLDTLKCCYRQNFTEIIIKAQDVRPG